MTYYAQPDSLNSDADGNKTWGVYERVNNEDVAVCEGLSEKVAKLFAASDEMKTACKTWVAYFEHMDSISDPNDRLTAARAIYHGGRLTQTKNALKKANGGT